MGIPVQQDPLGEINEKITKLIENLNWYKSFLYGDFEVPRDDESFLSRNKDIMNTIMLLSKDISRLEECSTNKSYNYDEHELQIKLIWTRMLLNYQRII
jgi:hypothetical protein